MAEKSYQARSRTYRFSFRKRKSYVLLLFITVVLLVGSYAEMVYILKCISLSMKTDFDRSDFLPLEVIEISNGTDIRIQKSTSSANRKRSEKLIVWYNGARRPWNTSFTGILNCGHYRCKLSQNPDHVREADGVIVNAFYLKPDERPPKRSTKQIWIFYCKEPPPNLYAVKFPSKYWSKVFNWTLTYRSDSDIVFPYGAVFEKRTAVKKDWFKIAKQKQKSVAWFVGNCKTSSRREDYVRKMQSYGLEVDIYGRCGKLNCSRKDERHCLKNYRFYLAFENSFCPDYVTEKFFKTFEHDVIPVVRGGANYSHLFRKEFLINTADFTSVKDLTDYLLFLNNNATEYAAFLQKKNKYRIGYPQPWCQICNRLHNVHKYKKIHYDIDEWLRRIPCYEPTDVDS